MFTTRYKEILNIIKSRIESGEYSTRLPSLRSLCSEFDVCKSTISKVLAKLSYAGLVYTTAQGTFICRKNPNINGSGIIGIITGKLSAACREQDDAFLNEIKKNLEKHNFSSVVIEVEQENWCNQDFWRRLDLDGFIFIYSSFYKLLAHKITFRAKPLVVANWLPEDIEEYFVDFSDITFSKKQVTELVNQGYRKIALAVNLSTGIENNFNIWRKFMRKLKLHNYNTVMEDFCYSFEVARHWAQQSDPPELILCVNVHEEKLQSHLNDLGLNAEIIHQNVNSNAYKRLSKTLVDTFIGVYTNQANIKRRNIIGRESNSLL